MKMVWNGTDSLFLISFPRYLAWRKIFYVLSLRLFARISDILVQEHYYSGELTKRNLKRFGMKKPLIELITPVKYVPVERIPHKGFIVLYYFPKNTRFNRWLYGFDIFLDLLETFKYYPIIFRMVDGSQDMSKIYPIVDLLIRPNRHDGNPRMVRECLSSGIPVVWTKENPDVEYFVNEIMKVYDL